MPFLSRQMVPMILCTALCLSPVLKAADAPEKPASPEPATMETPMDLDFQDVPIDDVIAFLQDKVPSFKAIVVRDSGVPDNSPFIRIKLRNVNCNQLIELLQSAYAVEFQPIPSGDIYCVKVHGPAARLKVYPLGEVVKSVIASKTDSVKDMQSATKLALDEVLTVVKASLTHVGEKPAQPLLELHEPTQTLVFRGTAAEQAVLEDTLGALQGQQTAAQRQIDELKARLDSQQRELELTRARAEEEAARSKDQLAAVMARLEAREKEFFQATVENERLKVRLEGKESAAVDRKKAEEAEKK